MSQDDLKVKGAVVATLYNEKGEVIKRVEKDNLVTTVGKELLAALVAGEAVTKPTHTAIGTSNTAASIGQTALVGTELARVSAAISRTGAAVTYAATFGAGVGTGTIEEAGILNAGSGGTMAARFLTSTFIKGAGDILVLNWTITLS